MLLTQEQVFETWLNGTMDQAMSLAREYPPEVCASSKSTRKIVWRPSPLRVSYTRADKAERLQPCDETIGSRRCALPTATVCQFPLNTQANILPPRREGRTEWTNSKPSKNRCPISSGS